MTTLETAFLAAFREQAVCKNRRPSQVSLDSRNRSKHEEGKTFMKRPWAGREDVNA